MKKRSNLNNLKTNQTGVKWVKPNYSSPYYGRIGHKGLMGQSKGDSYIEDLLTHSLLGCTGKYYPVWLRLGMLEHAHHSMRPLLVLLHANFM
jgi:hypothetical protein